VLLGDGRLLLGAGPLLDLGSREVDGEEGVVLVESSDLLGRHEHAPSREPLAGVDD
jgi:hypothetical protein